MVKSRKIKLVEYEARMGKKINACRILGSKPERKRVLRNQEIDGWIILRWLFQIKDGVVYSGLLWLRIVIS
jgi:hypothetical protein